MLKLIGYWSAPANPDDIPAFEEAYLNRHCPKAAKIPGLRRLITTRVAEGLEGTTPSNYRVAELLFDDKASYEAAEATPEFQAMREDGGSLVAEFGVTVSGEIGEEVDHKLGG
jgi:uncharacterized protein (TIGR02118 family)